MLGGVQGWRPQRWIVLVGTGWRIGGKVKERCGQCGCRQRGRQSRPSRPKCGNQGHHELGVGSREDEAEVQERSGDKCAVWVIEENA